MSVQLHNLSLLSIHCHSLRTFLEQQPNKQRKAHSGFVSQV